MPGTNPRRDDDGQACRVSRAPPSPAPARRDAGAAHIPSAWLACRSIKRRENPEYVAQGLLELRSQAVAQPVARRRSDGRGHAPPNLRDPGDPSALHRNAIDVHWRSVGGTGLEPVTN